MTTALERIRHEVNQLPYTERETLVRALELDLDASASDEDIEAAWDAEIGSRVAEIEAGKVTLVSRVEFSAAFGEARRKLAARRQAGA